MIAAADETTSPQDTADGDACTATGGNSGQTCTGKEVTCQDTNTLAVVVDSGAAQSSATWATVASGNTTTYRGGAVAPHL